MKKLFILISMLFFLASCGDDSTSTKKECNPVCGEWQTCDTSKGECVLKAGNCASNTDCKDATKPICDFTSHTCVPNDECTVNADCTDAAKPICNNGVCVADVEPECTVNADCTNAAKPICNNGVCVADVEPECTVNADCTNAAKPVCDNGVCVAESTGCVGLSVPAGSYTYNSQYGTYSINIDATTALSVGFYAKTPVGSYDLATTGVNDNYQTCSQCVLVYKSIDDTTSKKFFQESGSLTLTEGEATTGQSAGNIANVKLIEVEIESGTFHSTPVANGGCYEIETAAWNTIPECEADEDCTENGEICINTKCTTETAACEELNCAQYPHTECTIEEGSAYCACSEGYMLNDERTECIPVECSTELPCEDGMTCEEGHCVVPVPEEWTCRESYYTDEDCDCGCGVLDPTCADATAEACDYSSACEFGVNPTENWICLAPECTTDEECTEEGEICIDNTCTTEAAACEELNCGQYPNAECKVNEGEANCACLEGYYLNEDGNACVTETELCADVDCSAYANTECGISQGEAACLCIDGYMVNDEHTACIPVECTVDTQTADCEEGNVCSLGRCVIAAAEGWTCEALYYSDADCDCGCGVLDPTCTAPTSDVCDYNNCEDEGFVNATQNWICE